LAFLLFKFKFLILKLLSIYVHNDLQIRQRQPT
jgi:hypothetical protein